MLKLFIMQQITKDCNDRIELSFECIQGPSASFVSYPLSV